ASIAGKVLLFLDTCHAGGVLDRGRRGDMGRFAADLSATESGVVGYSASSGKPLSKGSRPWGNGAFTKAAGEGLRGRADLRRSGRVTVSMLETYISERVRELTQGEQVPTTAKPRTMPDFQVASVRVTPPLHQRWWFWGALSLAAAGVATGVGL